MQAAHVVLSQTRVILGLQLLHFIPVEKTAPRCSAVHNFPAAICDLLPDPQNHFCTTTGASSSQKASNQVTAVHMELYLFFFKKAQKLQGSKNIFEVNNKSSPHS